MIRQLPDNWTKEDLERVFDRLLRRIEVLENAVGRELFIGTDAIAERDLNGKTALWYDPETGKLNARNGQDLVTWTKD